ncbi:MAG TPA: membrane protein insertase YidC [Bacillales bacterium]|nr:membrane protein insertase YidC [Bacillales bacterium]
MKKGLLALALAVVAVLTGCQQASSSQQSGGFWHDYFVQPFTELIHFTASLFGNNYGVAIILITLAIRLILAPFFLRMNKNQREMKGKMDALKPEMQRIQKKLKETKEPAEQKKLQQEMMHLYREHGVNPLNMGCLPMLIQLPFLMGFYYAIRTSPQIASHNFLWFSLGDADIVMAVIACGVYLVQSFVSMANLPEEQKKMMRFVGFLSPAFILMISLNYPAALPLYWSVSGLFLIGQTLLANKLYPRTEGAGSAKRADSQS